MLEVVNSKGNRAEENLVDATNGCIKNILNHNFLSELIKKIDI